MIKQKRKWLWVVGFFLLVTLLSVWLVDQKVHPVLLHIAKTKAKFIAQHAILEGIKEQVVMKKEMSGLLKVEKDAQNRINFLGIDPALQAQVYTKTTEKVQSILEGLRDHPFEISLGQALESTLFADWGPDFTVKIWPEGSVKISLTPKMEAKGINMVMITLFLEVQTEMNVIVPFSEETVSVEVKYPLTQAFVVGEVPDYYFKGESGSVVPVVPGSK